MKCSSDEHKRKDCFCGLLLGTATGDALGLPAEGLSARQIQRRWNGDWTMRLCFGRGMVSDDTEHTAMVAQALLEFPDDVVAFQRSLAWKLRWWFLSLPAGVGWATARACVKLWCGFSPTKSGVMSAGNGPAMRAAVIGCFFADDPPRRREFVQAATRITHTDPRAEWGAIAVAEAAAWIARGMSREKFLPEFSRIGTGDEWRSLSEQMTEAYASEMSVAEFADNLGLRRGITGYALHTVPMALYGWLRHPGDFEGALRSVLGCGGDTDTVGAIVGALAGAEVGKDGIPSQWLNRVIEWPRSLSWLQFLGERLGSVCKTREGARAPFYFWPGILLRNSFFLGVVLVHGLRRVLPPY